MPKHKKLPAAPSACLALLLACAGAMLLIAWAAAPAGY